MKIKNIALVAHDGRKEDMMQWVEWNFEKLKEHRLVCTGTTGSKIKDVFKEKNIHKDIQLLKSGPLGGDQELGALIANNKIDMVVFLWDALSAQPHDPDVKALLRLCVVYNVPTACNRSTADYMITSPLMTDDKYVRIIKDYSNFRKNTTF